MKKILQIKLETLVLFIFLAISISYMIGASPTIGWRDGPEFVETATYLDIAHPAGFPTYSLMAKVGTWLPLGSLGYKVTLFSGLMASLSLYLLYFLILRILKFDSLNWRNKTQEKIKLLAAFLPVSCLAFSPSFWGFSIEPEVYTLNLVFTGLLFICAFFWSNNKGELWLMIGGFLYGLGIGNHAALILYAPALFAYIFLGAPKDSKYSVWSRLGFLAIFFFMGLAVYAYLPVRAATNPPLNFGDPETLERFWSHISDRKDQETHFKAVTNFSTLYKTLFDFATKAVNPIFWFLGFPLMLLGIKFAWRHQRPLLISLLILIVINSMFFIEWFDGSGLLPTFYLAFLLVALGFYNLYLWLENKIRAENIKSFASVSLLLFISITLTLGGLRFLDYHKHGGFLANEAFWDDFENFPPGSMVISSKFWFPFTAYQTIYGLRPDISQFTQASLIRFNHFTPPIQEKFPLIIVPPITAEDSIDIHNYPYIDKITNINLNQGVPVFTDMNFYMRSFFEDRINIFGYFHYRINNFPEAIILSAQDGSLNKSIQHWHNKLVREINEEKLLHTDRIGYYYSMTTFEIIGILKGFSLYENAQELILFFDNYFGKDASDTLSDDLMTVLKIEKAKLYFLNNELEKANHEFLDAISQYPTNSYVYAQYAIFLKENGQYEEAMPYLEKAVNIQVIKNITYVEDLVDIYIQLGKPEKAKDIINKALKTSSEEDKESYKLMFDAYNKPSLNKAQDVTK